MLAACSRNSTGRASNLTAGAAVNQVGVVNQTARSTKANKVGELEGYPTTQPDGSPLTEAYCSKVGDEPGNPVGNSKSCYLIACDKGDKASCDAAATYNGNLWPDGEPPLDGNQTD